ncbi:MAG: hypothetical protein ACLUI7_11100 [Coprococcus sp.]
MVWKSGKEYAQTKHNVGFMVVDAIADELHTTVEKKTMPGSGTNC